jgi:hypothetical protein
MIHILNALLVSTMIILSIYGSLFATYTLIVILFINIILVIYTSSVISGFFPFILKNNEKYLNIPNNSRPDPIMLFLLRCILLVAVYQIYIQGYVFLAGLATSTVIISIFDSLFKYINLKIEK